MRIYYRRGGKGAAPEGFDRVYTEVDGSGSKHTLVRSAQTVLAEARAYTTTEVQYEKTNGHDEGHFYIRFPRTRGLPPHKRRHTPNAGNARKDFTYAAQPCIID